MRKTCAIITLLFCIAITSNVYSQSAGEVPPALLALQKSVASLFDTIDDNMSKAAKKLSKTTFDDPEARIILLGLCGAHPYAVDCALVDTKGRMVTVEPAKYKKWEGADISKQEQVILLHKTKNPVSSKVFRSVEGLDAIDIEYPVFSPGNDLIGSVSMLIKPEEFLFKAFDSIGPALKGQTREIWVMQSDGLILFDPGIEDIGRMLLNENVPKAPHELFPVGKRIVQQKEGSALYRYVKKGISEPSKKQASWVTVSLYGTEWRLITSRPAKTIKLPQPLYDGKMSIERTLKERRTVRSYKAEPLTTVDISQILWAAQGVTEPQRGLRTAPSAKAMYLLETYLIAGNVTGVPAGMYKYQPKEHELIRIANGGIKAKLDGVVGQTPLISAPAALVITGNQKRSANPGWMYLEAGHAAQNVYLQAVSLNLGTVSMGGFKPEEVKKVLDLPDEEAPIYIMPLGKPQ